MLLITFVTRNCEKRNLHKFNKGVNKDELNLVLLTQTVSNVAKCFIFLKNKQTCNCTYSHKQL